MTNSKCLFCNNPLDPSKNQNKFCSKSCWDEHQKKGNYITCLQCEREKYIKDSDDGGRFCTLNCYWKWMKGKHKTNSGSFKKGSRLSGETIEKMKGRTPWNKGKEWLELRGENHPQWKGGITPLNHQIRTSKKYEKWRKQVFQRDEYTCQQCGDRCGLGRRIYLHAHHLKQFAEIMLENLIKTLTQAEACSELWRINNGTTLCKDCHYKIT